MISLLILILSLPRITLMAQPLAARVAARMEMLATVYPVEIPFTIWTEWILKVKFVFPIATCISDHSKTFFNRHFVRITFHTILSATLNLHFTKTPIFLLAARPSVFGMLRSKIEEWKDIKKRCDNQYYHRNFCGGFTGYATVVTQTECPNKVKWPKYEYEDHFHCSHMQREPIFFKMGT